MSMKKFYVGVKALIQDERGILLIKHSGGYWDMPGGRIDDYETFEQALEREISEELPGTQLVETGVQLGTFRIFNDIDPGVSLVLIFFETKVILPEVLTFSDEHSEHMWVSRPEDLTGKINDDMKQLILEKLK